MNNPKKDVTCGKDFNDAATYRKAENLVDGYLVTLHGRTIGSVRKHAINGGWQATSKMGRKLGWDKSRNAAAYWLVIDNPSLAKVDLKEVDFEFKTMEDICNNPEEATRQFHELGLLPKSEGFEIGTIHTHNDEFECHVYLNNKFHSEFSIPRKARG